MTGKGRSAQDEEKRLLAVGRYGLQCEMTECILGQPQPGRLIWQDLREMCSISTTWLTFTSYPTDDQDKFRVLHDDFGVVADARLGSMIIRFTEDTRP